MKEWERTARVLGAVATVEDAVSNDPICRRTGLKYAEVERALRSLERGGLIQAAYGVAGPLPGTLPLTWHLTQTGRRDGLLISALFGPTTDASRLTLAIVATLLIADGGWVPHRSLAMILRVYPGRVYRGSANRMRRAVDRLERAGLLERGVFDYGAAGHGTSYRLRRTEGAES